MPIEPPDDDVSALISTTTAATTLAPNAPVAALSSDEVTSSMEPMPMPMPVTLDASPATSTARPARRNPQKRKALTALLPSSPATAATVTLPSSEDAPPDTLSLYRGQTFPAGKLAYQHVQDYALYQNKQVRMQSRGGNHKKVLCTSPECPFYVQLYRKLSKADSKSWYVSSFQLEHMNCTSVAKPTKRQLTQLPAFRKAVLGAPDAAVGQLVRHLQGTEGIALQKRLRTVYRARDAIKEAMAKDQAALYQKLPSLVDEFQRLNPDAICQLECEDDPEGKRYFHRVFLASSVFVQSVVQQVNQKVLGLSITRVDGTSSANGNPSSSSGFDGLQVVLCGHDGNFQHFPIAIAVIASSSTCLLEQYRWFFQHCLIHQAGLGLEILSKTPIFCEPAPTEELVAIANELSLQLVYTGSMEPSTMRLYGWQPSNFMKLTTTSSEGTKSTTPLPSLQKEPPFLFLQSAMSWCMKQAFERHKLSSQWLEQGRKITPEAESMFQQQLREVGKFVVEECSETMAFVFDATEATRNRQRVDLSDRSDQMCTCLFVHQYEIPCKHVLALLAHKNMLETHAFQYFGACYLIETYAKWYRGKCIQIPIENELKSDDTMLPPKKQAHRVRASVTKEEPVESLPVSDAFATTELSTDTADAVNGAKVYRCGHCGQDGHNKRSCELLLDTDMTTI